MLFILTRTVFYVILKDIPVSVHIRRIWKQCGDPAFYLISDTDPDRDSRSQTNADPDPGFYMII